jgi:Co/Zn/Cd efflux system component
MSSTETALTAHVVVQADAAAGMAFRLTKAIEARFGIAHVTLQVEIPEECVGGPCAQEDGCGGASS